MEDGQAGGGTQGRGLCAPHHAGSRRDPRRRSVGGPSDGAGLVGRVPARGLPGRRGAENRRRREDGPLAPAHLPATGGRRARLLRLDGERARPHPRRRARGGIPPEAHPGGRVRALRAVRGPPTPRAFGCAGGARDLHLGRVQHLRRDQPLRGRRAFSLQFCAPGVPRLVRPAVRSGVRDRHASLERALRHQLARVAAAAHLVRHRRGVRGGRGHPRGHQGGGAPRARRVLDRASPRADRRGGEQGRVAPPALGEHRLLAGAHRRCT